MYMRHNKVFSQMAKKDAPLVKYDVIKSHLKKG